MLTLDINNKFHKIYDFHKFYKMKMIRKQINNMKS